MLSAEHRLRDSGSFRRAIRRGDRVGSSLLVVHVLTPSSCVEPGSVTDDRDSAAARTSTRAGLVVSKAVGNAVVRTRVKRQLRHLLRPAVLTVPAGSLIVVRALPAAAAASTQELGDQLTRCLSRATQRSAAA